MEDKNIYTHRHSCIFLYLVPTPYRGLYYQVKLKNDARMYGDR